jgi:hypothetical protein
VPGIGFPQNIPVGPNVLADAVRWLRLFEQDFRVDKWSLCRGLGCRAERQRVEVGLIRRASVKARMRPMAVRRLEVRITDPSEQFYTDGRWQWAHA